MKEKVTMVITLLAQLLFHFGMSVHLPFREGNFQFLHEVIEQERLVQQILVPLGYCGGSTSY